MGVRFGEFDEERLVAEEVRDLGLSCRFWLDVERCRVDALALSQRWQQAQAVARMRDRCRIVVSSDLANVVDHAGSSSLPVFGCSL